MSTRTSSLLAVGIVTIVLGAGLVGAGVVLGAVGGDGVATAAPDGGSGDRSLSVTATGHAEAEPDLANVRVSVEANADDPTVARQRVAENASGMRAALAELGLDEGDVRTTGFDIYEDRRRPAKPDERPRTTYRARHTFTIEVDDTDRVGEVVDAAVDGGATSVHGVEFTLSADTRETLRRSAIEAAMTNARGRADAMASAAGLSITGVSTARTGEVGRPRPVPMAASADGGAGGGTAIESGPVTVTAAVTVSYNATG